jgi:DNA-directed RNA polymerase specialized sigma24 family protein
MKERVYFMVEGKKVYPPKRLFDKEICPKCRNGGTCLRICYPLEWIDGNKARKEALLKEPAEQQPTSDYNRVIAELMEDKAARNEPRLEAIRAIKQPRRKMVLAATLAGMTQTEIALQTHISQGRISRIFQGLTTR